MKTEGKYFKIGEEFYDDDLNVKAKCVEDENLTCLDCVFYKEDNLCTLRNSPPCGPSERPDKTEAVFIKIEDDNELRIKEVEQI